MVHFIMEAVSLLEMSAAKVNARGSGSAQYPPSMMLGLLAHLQLCQRDIQQPQD